MGEFDYQKLGLLCGLEIHQQLDSETKLFCRCPNKLQGAREPDFSLKRTMRPVLGEMGTYDKAMLTEYEKDMSIVYEGYNDVICTYEMDETPPFDCSDEARKIAIEIALLINSDIIEEMHVCRKNYLDGSVPGGFQRTMIIGKDGYIELENGKRIGIDFLSLEEDAARKIKTEAKTNYFRLDRLGIPLVELTTKPDINRPDECREAAERLGLLLWSTKVKKVLGSIRQDVNVSIKDGTRIEIKGVQKLDIIPILINNEISRQLKLVEIKKELTNKKLNVTDISNKPVDITTPLSNTKSSFIANGIKSGKKLYGLNFKGFKGIFAKELIKDYRFGTEVSSKVKSISGLKGLIHSDENLKKYKFSDEDIVKIKKELNAKDDDCFVLVLGSKKKVDKAIDVIINRVKFAFEGVPPETRRVLEDGRTEFLRELHGGARLYPDTDTKAIFNTEEEIKEIAKNLPRYPWDVIKDYSKKFKLEKSMIKDLIFTGKLELFDKLTEIYPENSTLIITTLLETTKAIGRGEDAKNVENIQNKDFIDIFNLLKNEEISKEAIEELLKAKADSPNLSIIEVKKALNIRRISEEDLNIIIDGIVDKNIEIISKRKLGAMGPLMGEVMEDVRGMIDGRIVSDKLKRAIQQKLEELGA